MVSRKRKLLVSAVVPISQILVGIGGGALALKWVQPTEEMRVTALTAQATLDVGFTSTFLGQPIAHTHGLQLDIDVKAIDNKEYPKALEDVQAIFGSDAKSKKPSITGEQTIDKIDALYKEDAQELILKLLAKSAATFTFGFVVGDYLSGKAIRKIQGKADVKIRSNMITIFKPVAIGLAIAIAIQGINISEVNRDDLQAQVEDAVNQPVDAYLLKGTSQASANFDLISSEISKNLSRITGIQDALTNGAITVNKFSSEQVTYLIVSDPHNLPTSPKEIEALLRSTGALGVIYLGDFLNTGVQYEIDALSGLTIGDTTFEGLDEINTCSLYSAPNVCKKEGPQYPAWGVTGNHDTKDLMEYLNSLGILDLEAIKPLGLENTFALRDACYVDQQTCVGDYHTNEKEFGENALQDFLEKYPDPTTRPKVGFFASKDAALEFAGELDVIIYGGDHKFSTKELKGTRMIGVGTVGAGGPRGAEYSNAITVTFQNKPVITDTEDSSAQLPEDQLIISRCTSIIWDEYNPGSELVQPCF